MKEKDIQQLFVAWLKAHDIKVSASFNGVMIPDGGDTRLKWKIINSMKAAGLAKGFPDLFIPVPNKGHHGLFIELKASKGKVSEEQEEWLAYLNKMGYKAVVAYGLEQAVKVVEEYLDRKIRDNDKIL